MKATKIVATLGPASENKIKQLIQAGTNVFRLNASHADHKGMKELVQKIRRIDNTIAIMLDTKGPEIRSGKEKTFTKGELVNISNKDDKDYQIQYKHLDKLKKGNLILIDDGLVELEIIQQGLAKAKSNATVGANKTITIRGHNVELPFLSKEDKKDIEFAIQEDLDYIAASFVRDETEIKQLKAHIKRKQAHTRVIAKIEHAQAVENIQKIVKESQGLMVARGDLGVELPLEQVPKIQQDIIERANHFGRPVIVATQMLESMITNPRPTRAETSDVAQAILQGADALMLSGETAMGAHPVAAVHVMTTIARAYEHEQESNSSNEHYTKKYYNKRATSLFVTQAAALAAKELRTAAIITPTESGYTPRKISRFKPKTPIIAFTSHIHVQRQLQLTWGVTPLLNKHKHDDLNEMMQHAIREAHTHKLVKTNNTVVITAGHELAKSKLTNNLHIFTVKSCL